VIVMRTLKTMLFCGALALAPAAASAQAPASAKVTETQRGGAPAAPAAMPTDQEAEYAARELVTPGLENFEGGASLSITLGTTALVVLAVLVALLIIF
jgi:hypothetical protein